MDVKYGINESFTLDMTLVPDFWPGYNLIIKIKSYFRSALQWNRQFSQKGDVIQ